MAATAERHFTCPRCWQRNSLLVDLSEEGEQRFVADCEVCCNPVEFTVVVNGGHLDSFTAEAAEGD